MRQWAWAWLLCACLLGHAEQCIEEVQEEEACPLRGIALFGSRARFHDEKIEDIQGVVSFGVIFLERNRSLCKELEEAYVGRPLTRGLLEAIKLHIASFYKDKNQLHVCVTVPRQPWSDGVAKLIVDEIKLGEIRSRGSEYFTGTELMSAIRTKSGEVLIESEVFEDIAWMNQHPFRRTNATFVPGKRAGTADLELATIDRWPYRIYMGADNTGTIATERNRLFAGFNFGKTFVKDSQVSYQFTCSPNWNRFLAHTASARFPLPWRHTFVCWGGYAENEPDLGVANQKETGISWQVDGRYRVPIMEIPGLMQTLVIGYDFKETHNQIDLHRATTFKATADINQFVLGYELGWQRGVQRATFVAEAYGNPGGITEKNRKRDYHAFRFSAAPQYAYVKITHSYAVQMAWGGLSYNVTGQLSSENLLPSEQCNLTGTGGVRGFEERIALVDNAALLNLCFETPHWSPAKAFGSKSYGDDLYLLAFFDCGIGGNHQRSPGEDRIKTLGSIGPGIRYQFSRYIVGRLDYGFQLWHSGFFNPTHSRYNFGLIVSY